MKYKIISAGKGTNEELEEKVQEHLNTGWKLHGFLTVDSYFFHQPMIKESCSKYEGKWLSVKSKKFTNKNDEEKEWEYVSRNECNGVVSVVPLIAKNKHIVLVKQFRYAIGKFVIEMPAGLIDEGETAEQAANRELLEETGYKIQEILSVYEDTYSSPGILNEKKTIVVAHVEPNGSCMHEADENITLLTIHLDDLKEKLHSYIKDDCVVSNSVYSFLLGYNMNK